MNCESAINLLDGYIDGELDLVNQLEVRHWCLTNNYG